MQWVSDRLKALHFSLHLTADLSWGLMQMVLQEAGKSERIEESKAWHHRCYWSAGTMELHNGSLSYMGSACWKKKGAEWWHGRWIWQMVAHGCRGASFWGSPGFLQLAVFIFSFSGLSLKKQWEGTSMTFTSVFCGLHRSRWDTLQH